MQFEDCTRDTVYQACDQLAEEDIRPTKALLVGCFTKPHKAKLEVYLAEWKEENKERLKPAKRASAKDARIASLEECVGLLQSKEQNLEIEVARLKSEIAKLEQVDY